MNEVIVELTKVAWPTKDETQKGTLIVIIVVIIAGIILGIFDYLWSIVLKLIV